ncbi:MAG: signal peptidase I [Bacilli bacterium]
MKNKKVKNLLSNKIVNCVLSFVFVLCILGFSCSIFHRNYFLSIYVDGSSMYPTLNNSNDRSRYDFGIVDPHQSAINKIKRFDIITTYYPWDNLDYNLPYNRGDKVKDSAEYKIKRVIALPNETFKIENNDLYVLNNESNEFEYINIPFERNGVDTHRFSTDGTIVLNENEYWVMGDNWINSLDCLDSNSPVYKENLVGVLVAIEGTCDSNGNHRSYSWPRCFF